MSLIQLTLKAPITTAADDTFSLFHCFSEKINLIFQANPRQRIHLKNQALFSSKDKRIKMSSAANFCLAL